MPSYFFDSLLPLGHHFQVYFLTFHAIVARAAIAVPAPIVFLGVSFQQFVIAIEGNDDYIGIESIKHSDYDGSDCKANGVNNVSGHDVLFSLPFVGLALGRGY